MSTKRERETQSREQITRNFQFEVLKGMVDNVEKKLLKIEAKLEQVLYLYKDIANANPQTNRRRKGH